MQMEVVFAVVFAGSGYCCKHSLAQKSKQNIHFSTFR